MESVDPPAVTTSAAMSKDQLLKLYRQMLLIRFCEEQLARSHQSGLIHGACHTYVGQEAIAVGVCAHLGNDDVVFSTHRGHGHALSKGVPPRQLFAELFGRQTGCSQGRGGSMHLFAPEVGLMGTSGIVGPCILQAAGAGYSFQLLKTPRVAVAFFGDGAVNNGAFHEGLTLASIWKLPVLFVCENNQYATEVPFAYSAGNPNVAARATAYGLPGVEADGNDVLAIFEAAGQAIDRARQGHGPTLLECKTYRTRPHAEGMGDYTYRTREEVAAWKARCPIARLRQRLLGEAKGSERDGNGEPGQVVNAAELDALENEIKQLVADAQEFAEKSPWPDTTRATTHAYSQAPPLRDSARATGNRPARELSFMQATLEALTEEMARDPKRFVLGEGIGQRGGNFKTTAGLYERFGPQRLRDTPICERGFVGLAGGAAMTGTRPIVDFMFADFLLDAMGEIVNQIAKIQYMSSGRLKMPLLLRGCIGITHSAATHHSGNYYPLFAHIPGLRVVVPSCPYDAKGLFKRALRCDDPVLFLEHRAVLGIKGPVPDDDYEIEFGKAVVVREGKDVTVVALAHMVHQTLKAMDELAKQGVSVELIDPRTVAPLDLDTILQSLHKTGRLLIVDEAFAPCGLGSEIAARVIDGGFDDLDAPIRRLNGAQAPTPYSPPLEAAVVPNPATIVQAIRELMAE
jgi:2-oxoisovalerate dehydrogenase E1 component